MVITINFTIGLSLGNTFANGVPSGLRSIGIIQQKQWDFFGQKYMPSGAWGRNQLISDNGQFFKTEKFLKLRMLVFRFFEILTGSTRLQKLVLAGLPDLPSG